MSAVIERLALSSSYNSSLHVIPLNYNLTCYCSFKKIYKGAKTNQSKAHSTQTDILLKVAKRFVDILERYVQND